MRNIVIDLLEDVTGTYDQTKTSLGGRAAQRTLLSGKDGLGPQLTRFIDVFTDTAPTNVTPAGPIYISPNGRIYIVNAIATGVGTIVMYSFNLTTGAYSHVGRILYNMPNTAATTHTIRALKVDDSNTSNIRIFIATTGSVLINGGLFLINKLALSDFVPSGFPTIPIASGSDQKAVYLLQNPSALGVNHVMTAAAGIALDTTGTKVYLHNGIAATHQFHHFDYSTVPDTPGQTFTITIASPGVVTATAHGYSNNDQVALYTTGALPTGLTASTTATQTVYFVRNATANTFELSATSGGASINTTGTQSGVHTVRRAFGISSTMPYVATGNLPALSGTLLLTNSESYAVPQSGPNATFNCVVFATSTQIYSGKVSELTSGAITWPSLQTVNILGTSNQITGPTTLSFDYSQTTDRYLYQTATSLIVSKAFVNNQIKQLAGGVSNIYLEGSNLETVNFNALTISNISLESGWLFSSSTTTGQRGLLVMDFRSDSEFDYSYVISPVITINQAKLEAISSIEALFEETGTLKFYYRTSGFGSASGGWVEFPTAERLNESPNAFSTGDEIQIKVLFDIFNFDASTPAQLRQLMLDVTPLDEIEEQWVLSNKNTSQSGASPFYVAFRLQYAYSGGIPSELIVELLDDSENITHTFSTISDSSLFTYSTNNGTSWNALGVIPNTALTTELRVQVSSPSADARRARIRSA